MKRTTIARSVSPSSVSDALHEHAGFALTVKSPFSPRVQLTRALESSSLGGTDSHFLNNASAQTSGITGSFNYAGGGKAYGLNEKFPVKPLYDAQEFQSRVGKRVGLH